MSWVDVGFAIFWFIGGFALVVWRRQFARGVVRVQNSYGFHFGRRTEQLNEVIAVLVGLTFLALAAGVLFGWVRL